MKRLNKFLFSMLIGAAVMAIATSAFAATDALELTAAGLTATITDGGVCVGTGCALLSGDINPSTGTTSVTGTIDGWTINIASGTSHSPGLVPFGLDLTSLTATCNPGAPCTTSPLHVLFSDMNFTTSTPAGGFTTFYSATITGGGTTSESAFFDNGNALFTETTLIGTVGPFSAPGSSGIAHGGPIPAVSLYSLTLDQTFTDANGGAVSFSVDGNVTAPEPGTLALLGSGLLALAGFARKRSSNG